ncbi:MAG: sulfite exporter TauE/SafE family protein [Gammaproteobacteria bacterium]|nr:sulfite exporter TauE/SafE family protein [Gammaproteobacteria bacterium]
MSELILYILLGCGTGMLAGMLGVGGGQIIVPGLIYVFYRQGVSNDALMHVAIGTSLAAIVFTSLSAIYAHHRRGAVLWKVFARFTPGILVGALAGALCADYLRSRELMILFGTVLIVLALQMLFEFSPKPSRQLPGGGALAATGAGVGYLSALVGIGGGSMIVPFLVWCNRPLPGAVATAAACGLPVALAGALGFAVAGWGNAGLPAWSSGYIHWPACLGIVAASMLTAPLGARLAHSLPTRTLKRLFAVFLMVAGARILAG